MKEKERNLAEQKIQPYHLAPEAGSVLHRGEPPSFLLQPDCVLLCGSQRLNRLR